MSAAAVRLKPLEYVQLYGPPEKRCTGCDHARPHLHDAGGRLDRLVLQDIASWASWRRDDWGERTYPSVPEIARRIGYSDRSVQYAMRRLERCGWIERIERPGFTSLCKVVRVVEPVDERADVVSFAVHKQRRSRRRNTPLLHPSGATVAPELGALPEEQPPVAPDRGWDEADGADAPAQAAPRWRGEPPGPPPGTAPPPPAEPGAEPHRRMRGASLAAGPPPPLADAAVAGALRLVQPPAPPPAGDPASERWSRSAARQLRRCPRCDAPPGEACRNRSGRPRKANHAERRLPRL